MVRLVRRALPLGLLLVLLTQSAALAVDVSIIDNGFRPTTVSTPLGGSVTWTNTGFNPHTSTSDGDSHYPGVGLWDSPTLTHNETYTFDFDGAGSYRYHCDVHTFMRGTVNVAPTASPPSGTTTTVFTIVWASGSVPSGFNADVGIKRPGQPFGAWMLNKMGTSVSAQFTPDAGTGTYTFAARLQNNTTGGATTVTTVSISVTS